jgi:ABC-type sugar transport system permease subunit
VFPGQVSVKRHYEHEFRVLQSYVGGAYSQEQAVASIDQSVAAALEKLARENPQWVFTPEWDILPDKSSAAATVPATEAFWIRHGPWALPTGFLLALACSIGFRAYRDWNQTRRKFGIYLFILPTLIFIVLFSYYPISSAFYHSLFDWKQGGVAVWVGLENFREIFRDRILAESGVNLIKMLAVGLLISVTVPLAVAELIFHIKSERVQYVYRVLFIIPIIVPGIVTLLIWGFIYDYDLGLLNQILRGIGLSHVAQAWLGDPRLALYSLMFMGFPWVGGFALLIYTAGLQGIPTDVLDSCKLDGATGLRRVWSIDIPLVMAQIKLMVVLGVIGGVQGFQTQLLLTDGGPGYSTMVPGLALYQNSMLYDRMGYACAIGVVLFVVILFLTYINMRYLKSSTEFETK